MKFSIVFISCRSVSFELENESCYYSERPYSVFLNGQCLAEGECRNISSLFGLKPETRYTLRLEEEGGREGFEIPFQTSAESFRLNVRHFGAKGDGINDDTPFIQGAIMSAPHGGTVLIPPGTYKTGSLFLKSHLTIELALGARILGDTDRNRYPILPGSVLSEDRETELFMASWEGNPQDSFAGLITGVGVEDVRIIGEGILDGNAQNGDWWQNHRVKRVSWRPKMIFLSQCKDITFHGISIRNSPSWTCHPYFSDRLDFIDIDIENPPDSPNTDGFDPESCRDLKLLGSRISVGDDCVAIKAGALYMGRRFKRPTERAVFRNCLMEAGHGGIVLGSEMAGGIKDIDVSRCLFRGTDRGLRIKTRRGRGKDAVIDGISFTNIRMEDVKAPLVINMFYHCGPDGRTAYAQNPAALPVDERTPYLGSFSFSRLECTGCETAAGYFIGLPEQKIREVVIRDSLFEFKKNTAPFIPAMMNHILPMEKVGIFASNVQKLKVSDTVIRGHEGEEVVHLDEISLNSAPDSLSSPSGT